MLKIFDVLCQQKDIDLVLTRHEQGAAHMAEGYAKATGKAGVVLVTSGPGMTNIVTGLRRRVHGFRSAGCIHRSGFN